MNGEQETTGQGPSLDDAATRMMGLLSVDETSTEEPASQKAQPEPDQKKKDQKESQAAPDPKLASAATDDDDESSAESEPTSEAAAGEATDDDDPPAPRLLKVKVDGQELEVPEDEVLNGYSRTADYTRKTQELAAQRKQWQESEVAAVRAERHQYKELLGRLEGAITELHPSEPDWDKLRESVSPDVFAQEWTSWKNTQKRLDIVRGEKQRVSEQEAADADAGFKQHVAEQQSLLEGAIPEMKDPEKAPVLKRELASFAKSRGFSDDDLRQVTDHRLVLLLHDAMQHTKSREKAPKIETKIENAIKPSKPGGSRANNPKPNQLAAAKQRLRQSGSLDDGAAAIAHLLE